MENQIEREKKYRVARFYRKDNISYDLNMYLTEKLKRVSATKIRQIAEGVNVSEFVVIVEDETKSNCVVEFWAGQKDVVTGIMGSKRKFQRAVNFEIAHLFVSECIANCFAIKNNSEVVGTICERIFEFAKMEQNKAQKSL
ncbi:MAG: hypothetical protein ABI342_03760 [Nitrososphaera sp.]|jgi:hypothetical protein